MTYLEFSRYSADMIHLELRDVGEILKGKEKGRIFLQFLEQRQTFLAEMCGQSPKPVLFLGCCLFVCLFVLDHKGEEKCAVTALLTVPGSSRDPCPSRHCPNCFQKNEKQDSPPHPPQ